MSNQFFFFLLDLFPLHDLSPRRGTLARQHDMSPLRQHHHNLSPSPIHPTYLYYVSACARVCARVWFCVMFCLCAHARWFWEDGGQIETCTLTKLVITNILHTEYWIVGARTSCCYKNHFLKLSRRVCHLVCLVIRTTTSVFDKNNNDDETRRCQPKNNTKSTFPEYACISFSSATANSRLRHYFS